MFGKGWGRVGAQGKILGPGEGGGDREDRGDRGDREVFGDRFGPAHSYGTAHLYDPAPFDRSPFYAPAHFQAPPPPVRGAGRQGALRARPRHGGCFSRRLARP